MDSRLVASSVALVIVAGAVAAGSAAAPRASLAPAAAPAAPALARLGFEENRGQFARAVRFAHRAAQGAILLEDDAIAVAAGASVVRTRFLGANPASLPCGERDERTPISYFRGADRGGDVHGVRSFADVRYRDLWRGIDLVVHAADDEYDFELAPGADPANVRLAFDGTARLAADGSIVVETAHGVVRHGAPRVFQPADGGRREIAAAWELRDGGTAGFRLAAHDASLPLVVDPVIEVATYAGGKGTEFSPHLASAPDGGVFLTATTYSPDIPAGTAAQAGLAGSADVLVMRIAPNGAHVTWAAYLGGAGYDEVRNVTTDAAGDVYVCGLTRSADFPTTAGALDRQLAGSDDAFVARLAADGTALAWSTLLGGLLAEDANDLAVAAGGSVWVCGRTSSDDFPVVGGVGVNGGASTDGYLSRLDADGSALGVSSYLTGNGYESASAVEIDGAGAIYVAGVTNSATFSLLSGGPDTSFGGEFDVFLVKLNATASQALWGTYLGGTEDDGPDFTEVVLTLAGNGDPCVAGATVSPGYPRTTDAPRGAGRDCFVTRVRADGAALVWSSAWGGASDEDISWIARDPATGRLRAAGTSRSKDLLVAGAAPGGKRSGTSDLVFTELAEGTGAIVSSTFLGGSKFESNASGAFGTNGRVYVAGENSGGKVALVGAEDTTAKAAEIVLFSLGFPDATGAAGTAAGPKKAKIKTTPVGASTVFTVAVANKSATTKLRVDVPALAAPYTVIGAQGTNVVPPGGTLYVPIRFAPTAKGAAAATLDLATSDLALPVLSVPLSGKGK